MSAVISAIGSALSAVIDVIMDIVTVVWEDILVPTLKFIVGLFGIKDEDVIHTNVASQKIIEDPETYRQTMIKVTLEHEDDPNGTVISKLANYGEMARSKFMPYFEYGKTTYTEGLPDTSLHALVIDKEEVATIISDEVGATATVLEVNQDVPTKEEYVGFTLQGSNNYKPYNNMLDYNGYSDYQVDSIVYNYDNDNYEVGISRHEDVNTVVTEITTVSIVDNGDGTETQTTTVDERTVVTGTISGTLSDDTVNLSTDEVVQDSGTGTESTDEVVTSDTTDTNVSAAVTADTLIIDAFVPNSYIIAKYYTTIDSEWYYWLYDTTTDVYPGLSDNNLYLTQLDMLPIVVIRNNFSNIDSDTTSAKYTTSKEILDIIGIDIDTMIDNINDNPDIDNVADAFIHFSINPIETNKTVSKLLYEMFEYMFGDGTLAGSDNKYTATFSEGPVNQAIAWSNQTRTVVDGIIGKVGTYEHTVVGKTLILRRQETPEQYVELVFTDMNSVTFIDREGLWGTVANALGDADFNIPLSAYVVQQLSPLEQTELLPLALRITFYAAVIEHIKWYQTGIFKVFLQIIAIIIVVIISIYTAGAGATLGTVLLNVLTTLAVGYGIGMAMSFIMAHTNNKYLKALEVVAFTVAMIYFGQADQAFELVSAEMLLVAVTTFSEIANIFIEDKYDKLSEAQKRFGAEVQRRETELEKMQKEYEDQLDVGYVAALANTEAKEGYVKGIDAIMYTAVQAQYDYGILFDYDIMVKDFHSNKLRVGVI